MPISTIDIMNAAQALHAGVVGVKNAPAVANYKGSLSSIELPYVYVTHGPAEWTWGAMNDLQVIEATLVVHVLCSVAAQGTLGTNLINAIMLADRFATLYQSRQMLDINGTVEQTRTVEFSGIGDIAGIPSDQSYLGFMINVPYKRKELPDV